MGKLDGKVALVTGAGAPRSIGVGCARSLAQAGAKIVVVARTREKAEAQAERIRADGADAIGLPADVSDEAAVRRMVDGAIERFGRLDILVNNAAATSEFSEDGAVLDLTVKAWDGTFAVNVRGAMLGCRYAIPRMLESGGGSIINISSQAAKTGSHHAAYGASKAALDNLTLNIAFAYGKQGIRANAIAPGIIQSQETPLPEEFLNSWLKQTLTPRLGKPEDIGALAAFLASDDAGYITGQIIAVDGGILSHATWTGIEQW